MEKQINSIEEEFNKSRKAQIEACLLSSDDLDTLRSRIDEGYKNSVFCDGCGFCCIGNVTLTRLEFTRIQTLLNNDPSLLEHQGYVCPFLKLDREKFQRSLTDYGRKLTALESFPCAIYPERPITCRLYPFSLSPCRKFGMLKEPDLKEVLSIKDRDEYPEMLIQKWFITLRFDYLNLTPINCNNEVQYQLVPGWVLNKDQSTLRCLDGPHWLQSFGNSFWKMESIVPIPTSCDLEPWSVEIVGQFEAPTTYSEILAKFSDTVDPQKLGSLVGQLEISNIIVPIDIGLRMSSGGGFWNFFNQ